jgi:succinoglycan biosynthesis protein ExoA
VAALQKSRLGNGGGDNLPLRKSGFVEQGHHAAFDRLLFQSVKGYDETFSHNEDSELDIRIAATGGRIWLEASVPVTYFARSNMRGLIHQYFNYGVGRARTIKKHRMHLKLRQAAPLLTSIISFSFLTISFTNAWFLIFPSLYAGVCFAFGF